MSSSLKILVCYHKPAKLYKDNIFVPIHVGRALATQASKDGAMSEEEYQWMRDNMIGDDTGDNISHLNRYFCELTAIYWAWKNYDKLGNPDYIGFCHYRRLFKQEDIENAAKYDIMAVYQKLDKKNTNYSQFMNHHRCSDLDETCKLITEYDKKYANSIAKYLNANAGYFYNMFIMKKELFFEYCEFLFKPLLEMHKKTDYTKFTFYNQRMAGFIAERLTGIFVTEKEKSLKIKKCECLHIEKNAKIDILPRFSENAVTVCLSADDNYAPYLLVTIASIKENKSITDKYEVYVLDGGISNNNKKHIMSLADDNFFVRFIDINPYLDECDISAFYLTAHFSLASYYRFFIPEIFKNFNRVLYLDCDLIVNHNLAELYGIDMCGHALAAALDIEMHRTTQIDVSHNMLNYLTGKLKMKHPENYSQSGVLLLDISALREMDFTNKCVARLIEIKNPMFVDQCVLNSVFDGDYQPLPMKWNVLWHLPYYIKNLDQQLSVEKYIEYFAARKNPYIIHYCGTVKPWINVNVELADIWWKYARLTPLYEMILTKLMQKQSVSVRLQIQKYKKYKLRYWRYKLLSKITFGKVRKHYKRKRNELKVRLKEIKNFLKNK